MLEIDRNLLELTLDSLDTSSGAVTPPNMVTYHNAARKFLDAETPFVPVLHITADNIDLLTDTIDGKNTFHATQMVVFQRGGESSDESLDSIRLKKSTLSVPDILNVLPENQVLEEEPKFDFPVELEWYNDTDTREVKVARTKDFAFLHLRQNQPDADKLGWTQFNKTISTKIYQ